MPGKISMLKIENTIAEGQTAGTTSKVIRGKILSIRVEYTNTTPANSSDRDTNLFDMNPSAPADLSKALQEILNIGTLGAVPDDDNAIYYPETNAQDNTGSNLDLSDTEGGNVAKFVPFIVFGKILLSVTAAVAADITTVHLMIEEY